MSRTVSASLPIVESADPDCRHTRPIGVRFRFPFWTWAHRLTALALLLVFLWEPWIPPLLFHGNWNGAVWIGAWTILDPLAGLETIVASRTVSWELAAGMATTVVVALLLGRVFCGWVCPLGLVLELNQTVLLRVHKTHHRTLNSHRSAPHRIKFYVLAGCLVGSAVATVPLFATWSPINIPFAWRGEDRLWALMPLALLIVIEWWWPRVFCRSFCPLGAFYSLLGRWSLLRVRITGEERLACRHCSRECPMGIAVMEDYVFRGAAAIDDPDCTRCGICTDRCLGHILRLGWSRSRS